MTQQTPNQNQQTYSKKELVKLFILTENEWDDQGTGKFFMSRNDNTVTVTIKNDSGNEILNITLKNGDAFEKQNEKVVQIQGMNFQDEYALSFLDKNLCNNFCVQMTSVGVRQIVDGPILFNEENLGQIRDLVFKAWHMRNTQDLLTKVNLKDMTKSLNEMVKRYDEIDENSKEVLFDIVKVMMMCCDEKIYEEFYNVVNLKNIFVVLSFDSKLIGKSQTNFLDDYNERVAQIKHVVERSSALKQTIEYAFSLTYLRDVVTARYSDESICVPINFRLINLQKKIHEDSMKEKTIQKCIRAFGDADRETQRGISITIKQLCFYASFFGVRYENRVSTMIDNGIIEMIKIGLKSEFKSYYLDALKILFESGSVVTNHLIKKNILRKVAKMCVNERSSCLFIAFDLFKWLLQREDVTLDCKSCILDAFLPDILDILILPLFEENLCNEDEIKKMKEESKNKMEELPSTEIKPQKEKKNKKIFVKRERRSKYIERFFPFLQTLSLSNVSQIFEYFIEKKILIQIIVILKNSIDIEDCAKVNSVGFLKELIRMKLKDINDDSKEIIDHLIENNIVDEIKSIKESLPLISHPVCDEIVNFIDDYTKLSDKSMMDIIASNESTMIETQSSGKILPIKVDDLDNGKMLEESSTLPKSKRIETNNNCSKCDECENINNINNSNNNNLNDNKDVNKTMEIETNKNEKNENNNQNNELPMEEDQNNSNNIDENEKDILTKTGIELVSIKEIVNTVIK